MLDSKMMDVKRNKMKKTVIHKFLALVIAIGLASCDDKLDLSPAQSIDEGQALTTDSNVKSVLVGAYNDLGNGSLFGGNILRDSELLAANGEIRWAGTFNGPREIFNKSMTVNNADVTGEWLQAYSAINIANNVLSAIDVVNAADRDRVRGEALFIRGVLYFELVKFYAQPYSAGNVNSNLGVPLVLEPTRAISEDSQVPRNTVQEVYNQVISDLTTAESLLPSSNGIYATDAAAAAILSRVYLQMGDYANARDAAHRVITSGNYSLTNTYAGAFNNDNNSSEDIFAIQVNNQDGVNSMNTFFSIPSFGGRDGDVDILQAHLDLYDPLDDRLDLFYMGNGAMRSGKWNNQFGNVTMVRLAEMYLTRAEANFREGTNVGATPLADINRIRNRVNLPSLLVVTLPDILLERKLELAHEGQAIHDLKRLQGTADGFAYNAPEMVYPIPQREMDANPSLVQNTGYGN
ncbi:membrane protein [Roseivirga thermotolerans]|jgi:tetratricopeptide (TPR) repeat protein|uniref:Membrane protein n=2 Tax=Roseivirgaceae TaxID=2762306 RepID=A0ABQ3I0E2_9BACT|nr:membrane protein [Roseivirga thermotolerans]|tara:strand:- start:2617 stop:4005 length:1389 start_codon:yes stop_codon:yes gene_type:complete